MFCTVNISDSAHPILDILLVNAEFKLVIPSVFSVILLVSSEFIFKKSSNHLRCSNSFTTLNSNIAINDISVSLPLSTSSQIYTNSKINNRQYLDLYIRAIGVDNLSRTVRVYPGLGTGALIYSNSAYYIEYKFIYSDNSTLTYQVTSIQGWTPNTYSITHILYQTI